MASIEFSFARAVVIAEPDARWLARRLLERGQTFEPALLAGMEIEQQACQPFDTLRQVALTSEETHELARVLDQAAAEGSGLLTPLRQALAALHDRQPQPNR